jgi:hypothetical protein
MQACGCADEWSSRMLRQALLILLIFSLSGKALAMPPLLSIDQFLEVCRSDTVAEATAKGDAFGWARMEDSQIEDWRTHFLAYNGGTVQVIGWRRGESDGDGLLSFWIAIGPNGHKACSYSLAHPEGLLDGLIDHFGKPASLDKYEFGTVANWQQGLAEVSYSQVGSSTGIVVSYKN